MSTSKAISLNEMLDQAIEQMPSGYKKRILQRRLKRPGYRDNLLDELREKLEDDENVPASFRKVCGDDSFGSSHYVELEFDDIKEIIKLIIKYLPIIIKILAIFLTPLVMLFILPTALAGRPCSAQADEMLRRASQPNVTQVVPLRTGLVQAKQQEYDTLPKSSVGLEKGERVFHAMVGSPRWTPWIQNCFSGY